jgi:hypothetical protein
MVAPGLIHQHTPERVLSIDRAGQMLLPARADRGRIEAFFGEACRCEQRFGRSINAAAPLQVEPDGTTILNPAPESFEGNGQ